MSTLTCFNKSLDAGIKGNSGNSMLNPLSMQNAAELESNGRGSFTIAAKSTVEPGSLLGQDDETTNPTEFELVSDKPAQNDGQEELQDEEHSDDNNSVDDTLGPLSVARLKLDELLCGVGASFAAQENTQGPFTGNVSHPNGFLGPDHEHENGVYQDSASKELPCVKSNMSNELEPAPREAKLSCITQGCTAPDICDLYLHRGQDEFIARWPLGSEIKYGIDYDSFNTMDDANYALNQFQTAATVWNSYNIGVQFVYVEPIDLNQSQINFKLEYSRETASPNTTVFARSFFPIDAERHRPCKLYIFRASFDRQYRNAMWRTFLHEIAHILGGRHEDAPKLEGNSPCYLLGSPNDQSVLVGGREPNTINLQPEDIEWFMYFMRYPESTIHDPDGHKISIHDIVPREERSPAMSRESEDSVGVSSLSFQY
ncbi:hypothetical protein F4680DRAFT_13383 [Xylaria scruposa]|nr:hypothetical protein F4680DRAFT_13383 [Xylaria scruposa]